MTVGVVIAGLSPGAGGAATLVHRGKMTWLLSRSEHGGLPNAASCCGVVSHDERIGRVMAFESLANDITAGARRGVVNVYAVLRKAPWAENGSPWVPGRTVLVSRGLGGQPANGASFAPALGGDSANAPRCVAFLSRASNLVPGDRNRRTDAFVEDLRTQRIVRVSVDSAGHEANGTTSEVAVSGDCRRVAFVSDAGNLARAPRGTLQVYLHVLGGSTTLVSAHGAAPADADADQISLSRDGLALAFVSAAGDLGAPTAGVAQVWERALPGSGSRAIHLVSATPAGNSGNAPSTHPSIDHDGRVIAFQSLAGDLLAGANGVSQIVRATITTGRPELGWVSQSAVAPGVGNGPSYDASITDGGEWILFDSTLSNFGYGGDLAPPGQRQVYRWTVPELATYADKTHLAPESVGGPDGDFLGRTPSEHPDTSARGNYVPFESDDTGLDQVLPATNEPPWYPGGAAEHNLDNWLVPYAGPLALPFAPQSALTSALPGSYGTPDGTPGDPAADPRRHQVYVRDVGTA